jgi:molybdopterin molybdotransferase
VIDVARAQMIVRAACARLPEESVPCAEALGRVLARVLTSAVDLPPFANSAMDGYALHCEGMLAAGTELDVRGEQAAGDDATHADGAGAWSIMTGARMPDGLDTVVPVEQVEVLASDADGRPTRIRTTGPARAGQHVRHAGEDIARGALAIDAGTWLAAPHLMLLAGLGIARVPVVQRPKVALLCTGRELVDDPARVLADGEIRNSNGPFLAARLQACGAELVHRETVPDDGEAFAAALARALAAGAGIVLSTGAVSMGRYDFVPPTLRALGADVLFHKLAMRPGKPLLFARLASGALCFGLPGNPVSSAVGLRFFVEPALRVQLGLADETPWRAALAAPVRKPPGVRLHQKARLRLGADGRLQVAVLAGQESFKTRALLEANAWAVLPDDATDLPAGAPVDVYTLGHEAGLCLGE